MDQLADRFPRLPLEFEKQLFWRSVMAGSFEKVWRFDCAIQDLASLKRTFAKAVKEFPQLQSHATDCSELTERIISAIQAEVSRAPFLMPWFVTDAPLKAGGSKAISVFVSPPLPCETRAAYFHEKNWLVLHTPRVSYSNDFQPIVQHALLHEFWHVYDDVTPDAEMHERLKGSVDLPEKEHNRIASEYHCSPSEFNAEGCAISLAIRQMDDSELSALEAWAVSQITDLNVDAPKLNSFEDYVFSWRRNEELRPIFKARVINEIMDTRAERKDRGARSGG